MEENNIHIHISGKKVEILIEINDEISNQNEPDIPAPISYPDPLPVPSAIPDYPL